VYLSAGIPHQIVTFFEDGTLSFPSFYDQDLGDCEPPVNAGQVAADASCRVGFFNFEERTDLEGKGQKSLDKNEGEVNERGCDGVTGGICE
jgi:hypothetical protein